MLESYSVYSDAMLPDPSITLRHCPDYFHTIIHVARRYVT